MIETMLDHNRTDIFMIWEYPATGLSNVVKARMCDVSNMALPSPIAPFILNGRNEMSKTLELPMLDKPEKTQRLIATLKAALPFDVDLTPPAVALLAKQQNPIIVKPQQIVSDIIYTGEEGGITCHIHPTEGREAIFISLTHVRVHRSLPYASAVIDYQKHRTKKMKKQQGRF